MMTTKNGQKHRQSNIQSNIQSNRQSKGSKTDKKNKSKKKSKQSRQSARPKRTMQSIQSPEDYQVSVNGYKCIGPCSRPSEKSIHPLFISSYSDEYSMCPIDPVVDGPFGFPSRHSDTMTFDVCNAPDENVAKNASYMQIVMPTVKFDPIFFLKFYYGIENHEQGIEWLEKNSELHYNTKERVFNQLIVVYYDVINFIDLRIINHIRNIFLYKIQLIFRSISKYISINANSIIFSHPNSNKNKQDITDVKSITLVNNYIKTKLISENEVINFVDKILISGLKNMTLEQKENFTAVVVDIMIDYITQRIEISLK